MRARTIGRPVIKEIPEWKKMASQQTASTEDMEKSFCDLAYQAIANNLAPMLKPEHRVGFEIIQRNDDNTRMAAIFVFKSGAQKFYAPVFFINGTVKGNNLLYRVNQKSFVPATPDWCEYLLSLSDKAEGTGSPIADRRTLRNQMNLIDIVEPPLYRGSNMRKIANFPILKLEPGEIAEAKTFLESIKTAHDLKPVLRTFIEEDGSFNAIKKIANTAQQNFEFAQALFVTLDSDDYMPVLQVSEKKASAVEPLLVWHSNLLKNASVKAVTAEDMAKGYIIEDFRKEALVNENVFETYTRDLSSITDPGIYQVLLADGSLREMLVGHYENLGVCDHCSRDSDYGIPLADDSGKQFNMVAIDTTNHYSRKIHFQKEMSAEDVPMGKFEKDITAEVGKAKPEKGKAYRIFNAKKKSFSEPFFVCDLKETPDGLTEVTCSSYWRSEQCSTPAIILNPDYEDYSKGDRVYGKYCVFVEIAAEASKGSDYKHFCTDIPLGDADSLTMMVFDQGYKKATVKKAGDRYLVHTNEIGHFSEELNPPAAKAFLMVKCAMREPLVDEILQQATQSREYSFFYFPMTKAATNIRFNRWPEFLDQVNSEFNVNQPVDTAHIMEADRDEQYVEPQRIGDRYSQETPDTLDTKSPMELYELSQSRGNSALFEHGIVGALTNTYDSMAMVDKWIPKMEEALDCIGRTLFLFYWKPEDFAQAYGTDDQSQLENKLVSNFKSFGDLVIEMLQKSQHRQQGTPSLA